MIKVRASEHDDLAEVRFDQQPHGFIMHFDLVIIHAANEHRAKVDPHTWDYEAAYRPALGRINGRPC